MLAACIIACGLLWGSTEASAANTGKLEIVSGDSTIRKGEEIELLFSLDGYDAIENGVNALKGTLQYDSDVFLEAAQTDFETLNAWERLYYNPENGQLVLMKRAGSTQEEAVFRLKLTAKQSIPAKETYVTLKDISASEGKTDLFPVQASVKLSAVSQQPPADTQQPPTDAQQPSTEGDKQPEDSEESQGESTSSSKTEEDGGASNEQNDLQNDGNKTENKPENIKTGDASTAIVLFCGIVLIIMLLAYIVMAVKKGQKFPRGIKVITGIVAGGAVIALVLGSVSAFAGKGDLNGDGNVDYTDVQLLKKHLINLEPLAADRQSAADMNSDGKLTVTDLSLLIRKIEKTVDYEVNLSSVMEKFYYEKQEEVELRFHAEISYGAEIEKVTINGTEYKAEKQQDNSVYTVTVHAKDTFGVQEFHFTKVHLNSGQDVAVDHTEKIDVLKTAPSVEGFLSEQLTNTAQMKVSFVLKDDDASISTAQMEVLKSVDNTLITTEKITTGKNTFVLDLEEETAYTVHITAEYNLDSNALEAEEDHSGNLAIVKEVALNIDYRFTFGGMKTSTEDGTQTEQFSKNQPVVLVFESTNATGFQPDRAVINGKSYQVNRTENGYSVTLDAFTQTGVAQIQVEQMILENGKAFTLDKENTITVQIWKEMPQIRDLSIREDTENAQFYVAFHLTDPDDALTDRRVIIKNAEGKTVAEQAFEQKDFVEGVFHKNITLADAGLTTFYTVQVIADCDLSSDGTGLQTQKLLAEQQIKAEPRVQISSGSAAAAYVEKGENIELFYEIADNVEAKLTKLVINHQELQAELQPNGTWKAVITAPQEAGAQTFTLSQVVFANGTVVHASRNISVEVLKSAPVVRDYQAEDILEKHQVKFRFTIEDQDQAFTSGKVQLVLNSDGSVQAEEQITQTGTQEFVLDVAEQTDYTFLVLLTWNQSEDGNQNVTEDAVFKKPIYMIRDYNLTISNIKTQGEDEIEHVYFEPGSTVKVCFQAETSTTLLAEQAQVNGVVYNLSSSAENMYAFTMNIKTNPGVQTIKIEKLWMENGKELSVEKENTVRVEVLKAVPLVENFHSEQTAQDELNVQFVLNDAHGALKSAQVQILEEGGKVLLKEPVSAGKNAVSVPLTIKDRYEVYVIASYDRDSNALDDQSNAYDNETIYTTAIAASRDAIELKDITKTTLYYKDGNGTTHEVAVLDITGGLPGDIENYYAMIQMKNMPDFYTGIREFTQDAASGRVYAVIDQADIISYEENGARKDGYSFPLAYKDNEGEHPLIKSAEELFKEMSSNPKDRFELTEDLDASGISADAAAITGTFSGELDGNGYRILNLTTSLFDTLNKASVHDLVIENASVTTARRGILSNYIRNQSVIENVFIVDSSISNDVDGLGTFAGEITDSAIRESAAVNVSVRGLVAVGGIVGKTGSGTVVEDCYATGKVQGTYNHPSLGARAGGITGWHGGGTIRRCFTDVHITAPDKKGNGGIIGGPNTGTPRIESSLSMSTGTAYRIAGFDVLENVKEVYEYSGSKSTTNITDANKENVKVVDNLYDRSFYENTLGFDEHIWDLEALTYEKKPNLKSAPVDENKYGIPNYSVVKKNASYRADREQAYANMAKLMPFSDTRMWVEYGNRLSAQDALVTQTVQFILPLDQNNALVTGILKSNPGQVQKIRFVFADAKMQEYAVSYQKLMGDLAASYKIDERELSYQFHNYTATLDKTLLDEIVNRAVSFDYTADIASLTQEEESRLYTDYYNETIKNDISGLFQKLLVSQENYPTYCSNKVVQELVEKRLKEDETLKKLLYAYNYYDKWYHIDYKGVILSDLLFFSGERLSQDMTASALTEKLLAAASNQRETNNTVVFYNSVLKNYTEKEMMDFLGDLSYSIAGYDTPSDWFADNFDGILTEQKAYNASAAIKYRIWDILSGLDDGRKRIVLPVLTAPQEDMYLISLPTQLMIGSMNRYQTYLNKDGNERERMQQITQAYAEKMGIFYGVSSKWMSNSTEILNSFVNIQYDTRMNFPQSDKADAGEQKKGETKDPVLKWVYEAIGSFSGINGSAAYADGTNVFWMWDAGLGTSDYIFFTFSHETAHNQDGRYFYGGAGRREGTGGEAHADGNIAQEMRDGCMVFNISKINDIGTEMTNNFSYERIDSPEKIHSYYAQMFETGYVLDYLAAQAFLALTPEQQAKVAVQAEHTPAGNASMRTVYSRLTADEIKKMNLKDMDDLWDYKISIRNPNALPEVVGTATDGSYGFESFYYMNWYQSHNDNGSPDTHSFKRLGQEMLGLAGYEEGYITYISARSENDLDALRKITGNDNITWREYKLGRYSQVEQKLDQIPYFDKETVIEQFKKAFEADAQNGNADQSIETKRMLYGMIKRVTGDFSDGGIYESPKVISITSAEQLIELAGQNPYGYYRLSQDIDFSSIHTTGGSYIQSRFIGVLDGNGYKLTGMQYPLFADLQYAQVKNLTISAPSYQGDAQAMLVVKSKKVTIGNVKVEDADMQLPLVKTKNEGYYEYGNMSVTIGDKKITSTDDFLAIGNSAASLKKKYVLDSNLDFSGISHSGYLVSGTFAGSLDGNGHTITGLDAVLFEKISGAEIKNLTIEEGNLTADIQKGILANEVKNSTVEGIKVKDIVISNNANQVGGLAGVISTSTIKRISLENVNIQANNTIGGLAGQFDGTIVEDCLVTGRIEGTIRHPMGTRIGGITGWLGGGMLNNCFTKVDIAAPDRTGNGGLIGGPQNGSVTIENSVSLSTGVNAGRIAGWDVLDGSKNVYELESSDSQTNIHTGNHTKIFPLTELEAADSRFYMDTLGWSGKVWNFEGLAAGRTPALR